MQNAARLDMVCTGIYIMIPIIIYIIHNVYILSTYRPPYPHRGFSLQEFHTSYVFSAINNKRVNNKNNSNGLYYLYVLESTKLIMKTSLTTS